MTDVTMTSVYTHTVLVETDMLQMRVVEQLFWVDVDWRLALAFAAQAPFRVDEPPEFWPYKRAQKRRFELCIQRSHPS